MTNGLSDELKVAWLASEYGITPSLPCGGQERYDQIWDVNGELLKIQIKKCSLNSDGTAIQFSCQSKSTTKKYSEDEIDAIVTCHEFKLYYIPFKDINKSSKKTLYFYITKEFNGNIKQVNWAEDFLIEKQLGDKIKKSTENIS